LAGLVQVYVVEVVPFKQTHILHRLHVERLVRFQVDQRGEGGIT
jgi:hypothetical protein